MTLECTSTWWSNGNFYITIEPEKAVVIVVFDHVAIISILLYYNTWECAMQCIWFWFEIYSFNNKPFSQKKREEMIANNVCNKQLCIGIAMKWTLGKRRKKWMKRNKMGKMLENTDSRLWMLAAVYFI